MFLESDTTVECAGKTPVMEAGEQARPQTCVWLWDRNVPHLCGNVAAVVAATRYPDAATRRPARCGGAVGHGCGLLHEASLGTVKPSKHCYPAYPGPGTLGPVTDWECSAHSEDSESRAAHSFVGVTMWNQSGSQPRNAHRDRINGRRALGARTATAQPGSYRALTTAAVSLAD